MTAPILQLDRAGIQFGGLKAVSELDLVLNEGCLHGLIGPNGAGKTTVFNLITGIYRPTEGDIRLQGESIVGWSPTRIAMAGIGRTFQNIRLFGDLSVLDNVMLGTESLWRMKSRRRAAPTQKCLRLVARSVETKRTCRVNPHHP